MPHYESHLWFAQKVGVFVSTLFFLFCFIMGLVFYPLDLTSLFFLSLLLAIVSYYSTVIGGVIPDIDLSRPSNSLKTASIPYRILVNVVKFSLIIFILFHYANRIQFGLAYTQLFGGIIGIVVMIVVVRLIPDILHYFMPPHRGLTHRPIVWFVMGIFSVLLVSEILQSIYVGEFVQSFLPLAIGIPVFLGTVTHTSMDTAADYVRDYAPDPVKRQAMNLAPWVPKHKPIIVDIPRLARIAFDSRAPLSIRIFVIFTFAYGMIPLDLINSFIPIIGWIDDLFIYLTMRGSVYRGYNQDIGFRESLSRELKWNVIQTEIFTISIIAVIISLLFIL